LKYDVFPYFFIELTVKKTSGHTTPSRAKLLIGMDRTTQLYLFRHGETDWNRERRFQGHTDIPLNNDGRRQAQTLIEELTPHPLDALVTSDLQRAKETAEIVNSYFNLPIEISKNLRECRLGDPEGMLREKIVEDYGAPQWNRWLSVDPADQDFGFPNGETKNDHLRRLLAFLEPYCKDNPQYQNIAVSTHGGSVRRLVHHCKGAPLDPIPLPNCALYQVTFAHETGEWTYGRQLSILENDNIWGKDLTKKR
jgi:broad specificity phosphatase PhoE